MKIFDGIFLCTDLDGTLLKNDKTVSDKNKNAIEYFKSNGGIFTFITGRTAGGVRPILEQLKPNSPIGCLNGGSIYDWENNKNLYEAEIDRSVIELVKFVDKNFPKVGFEVITHTSSYLCKRNRLVDIHISHEKLPCLECDYHNVPGKLAKVLLVSEAENIELLIPALTSHKKACDFDFIRSDLNYYEILPAGASKGNLMLRIADILGIDHTKTVAVGDNENDISMIKSAQVGYAVSNAFDVTKQAADFITVSNEEDAIAKIIHDIENGILNI